MAEEDPEPPIFAAVRAFDVEALRRLIAAGVDPDMREYDDWPSSGTPLYYAVCWRSSYPKEQMRERLECISLLLEAGASVDSVCHSTTPLHCVAGSELAAYHAVIAALLEAGADPNFTETFLPSRLSVLAMAARDGTAGAVRMLISAGAVDLDRALESANDSGKLRNCAPLLRAGASLPPHPPGVSSLPTRAYIENIRAAGGYKAYEKAHRQRLVAMFLPKFPTLPVEMVGRVLEFTWDIGGH